MKSDTIELTGPKISFGEILGIVDTAIKEHKSLRMREALLNQKNNNMVFLKWLQKHKIINIITTKDAKPRKAATQSRQHKAEITLQLKALEATPTEIAGKLKVQSDTVQGYLRTLGQYNSQYLSILKVVLKMRGVSIKSELKEFPSFPIQINLEDFKKQLSAPDQATLDKMVTGSKWLKYVVGQNLGNTALSILLPEK